MADVFISYSSKDSESAEYLLRTLESMYLTCWMAPRDIPKGDNYADLIPSALREAKVYLLLVSKNSQESVQVGNEINFATHIGMTKIAVRLDDVPYCNAFDYHIARENRYEGCGRLVAATSELVERIHREIENQSDKQAPKQEVNYREKLPLIWLLLVAGLAVILICVCNICVTTRIMALETCMKINIVIIVLAVPAAALVRTPLFHEDSRFFRKFKELIEIIFLTQ